MTTSAAGVERRRAGLRWFAWAAAVAALALLAHRIGGLADPAWAEEVALVLVIGLATAAAPPVLARVTQLSADSWRPIERDPETSLRVGTSRSTRSAAGRGWTRAARSCWPSH